MGTVKTGAIITLERLREVIVFSAIGGAIIGVVSSALAFGLAAGWHLAYKENKFFPVGWNRFEDLGLRFLLISFLFVLFLLLSRVKGKSFLQILVVLPLVLIIQQMGKLVLSNPGPLPNWISDYSQALEIILHVNIVLIVLASFLIVVYIYALWRSRRGLF